MSITFERSMKACTCWSRRRGRCSAAATGLGTVATLGHPALAALTPLLLLCAGVAGRLLVHACRHRRCKQGALLITVLMTLTHRAGIALATHLNTQDTWLWCCRARGCPCRGGAATAGLGAEAPLLHPVSVALAELLLLVARVPGRLLVVTCACSCTTINQHSNSLRAAASACDQASN
jgi:hypothetical protein